MKTSSMVSLIPSDSPDCWQIDSLTYAAADDSTWSVELTFKPSCGQLHPAETLLLQFSNVSALEVDPHLSTLSLMDLGIIDRKDEGWCADQRYELYDIEGDRIRFFYENFTVRTGG